VADSDPARPAGAAIAAHSREWRFPSAEMSVRRMRHELRPFLEQSGLSPHEVEDLLLAACEAAANGIEHAQHPAEPFFDVQADIDGPRVRIVVRDYGRWTPGPTDGVNRGRGLHMMTMLAVVSLTSGPLGTTVTLSNLV
jgi:anti-sigma regulatory factor (Ser/Thr protein kinase)